MKFDITDWLFNKNITKFSLSEVSDKIYIDFGNDFDILNSYNVVIIYDDEINKTYIENGWIDKDKVNIYIEYVGSTIIYEFNSKTKEKIYPKS